MSTAKKETGKRRYSIRLQFTLIFFFLMLGALGLYWIISNTFLGRYYLREKRLALQDMYNKVNEAASEDEIDTEDFDQLLQRSADKENISLILMDAESATVKLHASDGSRIQNRMWDNLFDATPDIDDIDLIPSRYYIVDTLVEEEHYRISIIYDSRIGMKMLELFGVLDDGCFCLMQTALESIENSSAIASRFMGYIGIVISLAGAVFALLLAGRITEPIRELTEISARMKKLDFSAKYEGSSKTEIAELGDNINELSEILEKTISELKTANAELREDLEKREELEEMRQEFLSNVTHELKTPLALIRGYAEGLADGVADDPESTRFYTEVIIDEAGKMNQMVTRLLSLNQLEFGKTEFTMVRFDIVGFIRGCLSSAGMLAQKKDIRVEMENHPPIYVWADEFWTEEVFMNYFSNAVNHCEGEKVIDIHFEEKQNCVRVTVFNTGRPIPAESVPHLWEKFYKVDKARTREYGGSGVGLSIVKAIMDQMKQGCGVINFDNGVAFWFELDTRTNLDSSE